MCNCQAQIDRAIAKNHPGLAEYLSTRCDMTHGQLEPDTTTETEEAGR